MTDKPKLEIDTYIKLLDDSGNRLKTILITDIWIDQSGKTILSVSVNYSKEKSITADYVYKLLENHPSKQSIYYLRE